MLDKDVLILLGLSLLGLFVSVYGAYADSRTQHRPVELFWEAPTDCSNGARAFTLVASVKTPNSSGATVWACK